MDHPHLTFDLHQPVAIRFGAGQLSTLATALPAGADVLVLTSSGAADRGWIARLEALLPDCSLRFYAGIRPEPELMPLDGLLQRVRPEPPQWLIGLGGGSAIDAAKALALGLAQAADFRFAAWAEQATELRSAALPTIMIPTTAGSGSEVTPFAALWNHRARRKYSLDDACLFPRLALVDSELSADLPPLLRLSTGLDAMIQALEAIWNRHATPISTLWATEALRLGLPALPALLNAESTDSSAAARMQYASLLAGLAISQTRTALCHAMSYPLSAWLGIPHGLACAFSLLSVWEFNLAADDGRLRALAQKLGLNDASALGAKLRAWLDALGLTAWLRPYLAGDIDWPTLIAGMGSPERAGRNLRALAPGDLETLCRRSLAQLEAA